MIGLIKKQLDPTCRELAESHEIVQWFEDEYSEAEVALSDTRAHFIRDQLQEENKELDQKPCYLYAGAMCCTRFIMCKELLFLFIPTPSRWTPLWAKTLVEVFSDMFGGADSYDWCIKFAPRETRYFKESCHCTGAACCALCFAVSAGAAGIVAYCTGAHNAWVVVSGTTCFLALLLLALRIFEGRASGASSSEYSELSSNQTQVVPEDTSESASPEVAAEDAQEKEKLEYIFIDFNAWEFSETEFLWTALIRNLYQQVENRIEKNKCPGLFLQDWKQRWRVEAALRLLKERYGASALYVRAIALVLCLLFVSIMVALESSGTTSVLTTLVSAREHEIVVFAVATVTFLVSLASSLCLISQTAQDSTSRGDEFFEQGQNVKDLLGFMSKVKEELNELFNFLREFRAMTKTQLVLVLFIDDLDRCLGGKNVKVLEALQLMLSVPGEKHLFFTLLSAVTQAHRSSHSLPLTPALLFRRLKNRLDL